MPARRTVAKVAGRQQERTRQEEVFLWRAPGLQKAPGGRPSLLGSIFNFLGAFRRGLCARQELFKALVDEGAGEEQEGNHQVEQHEEQDEQGREQEKQQDVKQEEPE